MPYRDLEPFSKQLTIVVGLTVVGFMAFGLALSFYRNVLFEQTLENISGQNAKLHNELENSQGDLEYYQSFQYKDKYAKENLGRLIAKEKVLIIMEEPEQMAAATGEDMPVSERQQAAYEEYLRQLPVIEHWRLYLFRKEDLEKLKRSL